VAAGLVEIISDDDQTLEIATPGNDAADRQSRQSRQSNGRICQQIEEGEITMADPITAADVQAFLGELGYSIPALCSIRFSAW
jgi:hypothetical protein